MVAFLFPGQGSQFVGMGRDLAAASAAARATFEEADQVLGFGLTRLCFEGPESELTRTSNAQPAILTHSVAALRALGEPGPAASFAAGHSLGEFTAWVAAGSLTLADALRTVRKRGELMEASGRKRPGTMAALLGLDVPAVEAVCAQASDGNGVCVPANDNAPGQIVVSGDVTAVERVLALARDAGAKRALRLNVSGAFHSPLMAAAAAGLAEQLNHVPMAPPRFPVVSNVTAAPVQDPAEARRLLIEQLTSRVRWTESVRTLTGAGVRTFLELGPGSVLAGLVKRIDRSAAVRSIGTAADLDTHPVS